MNKYLSIPWVSLVMTWASCLFNVIKSFLTFVSYLCHLQNDKFWNILYNWERHWCNKAKERTKNWALRNSCQDYLNFRVMVINRCKLLSLCQIRTERVLCNTFFPTILKCPNKHLKFNRVKSFFERYTNADCSGSYKNNTLKTSHS